MIVGSCAAGFLNLMHEKASVMKIARDGNGLGLYCSRGMQMI